MQHILSRVLRIVGTIPVDDVRGIACEVRTIWKISLVRFDLGVDRLIHDPGGTLVVNGSRVRAAETFWRFLVHHAACRFLREVRGDTTPP